MRQESILNDIRIIALDLDGTLLTSDKRLSDRNRAALERAAAAGIAIVPTTGRIFPGLPAQIRQLPFLRYAITANGASVYDAAEDVTLYREEIPVEKAVEIMAWLEGYPVIYDCYMEDRGWMTEAMWLQAETYAPNKYYVEMIRTLRKPVPELKAFLLERGSSVQKIQAFCLDEAMQAHLLREAPRRFDALAVSTSVSRNVEINQDAANKGSALLALAKILGVDRSQVMAFGDGINDLDMIRAAGVGVAMENAVDAVKQAADRITLGNDADGVAVVIEALPGIDNRHVSLSL